MPHRLRACVCMHADKRMPQAHEDGGAGRSRSVMLTETLRRKRTSRKEAWFVYSPGLYTVCV